MKQCSRFIVIILILLTQQVNAAHLKGGWIQYEYLGKGAASNSAQYRITIKQYLLCSSTGGQIDQSASLGIFDGATNALFTTLTIPLAGTDMLDKGAFDPCINPRPSVCYRVDRYITTVDLPINAGGYVLAVQRCCRVPNIINLAGSSTVGVTYLNKIPGTINGVDYYKNSSPVFAQKDTAVVCHQSRFTFNFSATDADGDSLAYSFCDGLTGGSVGAPKPTTPSNPPYASIPYSAGYSGGSPLGQQVTIDPGTGIISGIAPAITGDYVLAVCTSEFRNGVLIGTTKKEIHISVADCTIAGAVLKPGYITCNSFTLAFQNESTNSAITSYLWDFGEKNGTPNITSTDPIPVHTYKDSGSYPLKLTVTGAGGCKDSATSIVKVYPGFVPDFTVKGSCFTTPYQFSDATKSKYGIANSWRWDFGDKTTLADTASHKDTAWTYPAPVTTQVRLIATDSKGCIDTVIKPLTVSSRPSIGLPFRDTLICSIDTLGLKATISNTASIAWVPDNIANRTRILYTNTASPLVYPQDTTNYIVMVNDNGCVNTDTVKVNVLKFITVQIRPDTTICKTDSFMLRPVSQALSYSWAPSYALSNATVKYPAAAPLTNTIYTVTANLGKCQARAQIAVRVAPYPLVNISTKDTTICFGQRVQLQGSYSATAFYWSPGNTLLNANALNPIAGPVHTTRYVLTAADTLRGCPKSVSDTVVVTVIPLMTAYAGKDTAVVPEQPLQLNATGSGTHFLWSPASYLNDPNIANPIATLPLDLDSIRYTVRVSGQGGCYAEDALRVRVFRTAPQIFVPSAFTPNNDKKNDVLRPITVGISKITYFRVYNRWGQLLFSTTEMNKGWDGDFNGVKQPSDTYVYETEGTDYLGKKVYRKGTSVLIR